MFQNLKNRFPSSNVVTPVAAWLFFLIFSFALYRFFWYVPSWLGYRSVADVLTIGYYTLAFSFVESMIWLACLLLLAALLPGHILKERFVVQTTIVIWAVAFWAWLIHLVLDRYPGELFLYLNQWGFLEILFYSLAGILLVILSIVLLSYLVYKRFKSLEAKVLKLSERVTVFLYIYLPLGIVGLVIVVVRNFFNHGG
jgi:hypothetical protein